MRLTDEMDRLILEAVGDDFITLDCIIEGVSMPAGGAKLDPTDLQRRLLSLVSDKLINAYLLHAEPPFITPIQIGSRSIPTSWFYITQRGRKCLRNSARKYQHVHRDSANQSDASEFTSAVNF
jgi:hypothetical protein